MVRTMLLLLLPLLLLEPAFAEEETSETGAQPEKKDESIVKILTVEETLVLSLPMKGSYDQHQEAIGRLMAYARHYAGSARGYALWSLFQQPHGSLD